MKKLSLILLMTTGLFCASFGQTEVVNDILSAGPKKEGVYMTFAEFRTNSPSVKGEIKVSENGNWFRVLDTSNGKYEKMKSKAWGACVNDTVYIYLPETHGPQSPHIYPLQILGRYCYFEESGMAVHNLGAVTSQGTITAQYILNINNGQVYKLSNRLMEEILQKDPELQKEFKARKSQDIPFMEYIRKLNVSRSGDVKPVSQ
jgi:hypothetical protein